MRPCRFFVVDAHGFSSRDRYDAFLNGRHVRRSAAYDISLLCIPRRVSVASRERPLKSSWSSQVPPVVPEAVLSSSLHSFRPGCWKEREDAFTPASTIQRFELTKLTSSSLVICNRLWNEGCMSPGISLSLKRFFRTIWRIITAIQKNVPPGCESHFRRFLHRCSDIGEIIDLFGSLVRGGWLIGWWLLPKDILSTPWIPFCFRDLMHENSVIIDVYLPITLRFEDIDW